MAVSNIYQQAAPDYRSRGYSPRPITPGQKSCPIKGWQKTNDEYSSGQLLAWEEQYASYGVGLLMGSSFPDGSKLVALDIDRNEYVRLAQALLRRPSSGRIGAKGIVLFARLRGDGRRRQFRVKLGREVETVIIGELLGERTLCVLPPTIHPVTDAPYRWVGKPLLEADYRDLPLIEA